MEQQSKEKHMKALAALGLASVIALAAASPAGAMQGCGRGYHRGPYGHCRPNVGLAGPQVFVVGRFYPGRGYWYNGRWYHRRYRYHRGWRYGDD
jgi:hypothetical protein